MEFHADTNRNSLNSLPHLRSDRNDFIKREPKREPSPLCEDNDIPPPPSTGSSDDDDDDDAIQPRPLSKVVGQNYSTALHTHPPIKKIENDLIRKRKFATIEASKAPSHSQDSAFFSFSRQAASHKNPERKRLKTSTQPHPPLKPERYYTKAFNFVIEHVLDRYSHILQESDVDLARLIQTGLDDDALALFVRIYRRKQPHWYRVSGLVESYASELDLQKAVQQLCSKALIASSKYAAQEGVQILPLLARELLPTLSLPEVKGTCSSIVEGKSLKRLPKNRLLPALEKILSDDLIKKKPVNSKRLKQMTLSGLSPAQCLSKAILKCAGHSICIPTNVLTSLARIHFLFFLEDGHDSPNVILADTGKAKFPDYICEPSETIFPSAFAYEDYENAVGFEEKLNAELENGNYEEAAHLGSIAELEVREFLTNESQPMNGSEVVLAEAVTESSDDRSLPSDAQKHEPSQRPIARSLSQKDEINNQLQHPFFRRYTALWVYARACWHSVHALERLGEHEGAVSRLQLLLATELIPRRRGKCLNRLSINLFKHLEKADEALRVILDALGNERKRLNFGDELQLAQRGFAIHKKVQFPVVDAMLKEKHKTVASRKKAATLEVMATRPQVLLAVLNKNTTKMGVRKIFGKSLNVRSHERREKVAAIEDPWQKFIAENSRDSLGNGSAGARSLMGKAVFSSRQQVGSEVSVEQYCLEWYIAKEGWEGIHDEGGAIRFLFCLLMWDAVIFKEMGDVFQTPYQNRPLDLMTEAFFESRKEVIEKRVGEVKAMNRSELCDETMKLYEKFEGTRGIGCAWSVYSREDLGCIAGGLGGQVVARCCYNLCRDYGYWSAGLPDLTLWQVIDSDHLKEDGNVGSYKAMLVEVKSARDSLSDKQRAWLLDIGDEGGLCEVCKVVEIETSNENQLEDAEGKVDYVALGNLASVDKDRNKNKQITSTTVYHKEKKEKET